MQKRHPLTKEIQPSWEDLYVQQSWIYLFFPWHVASCVHSICVFVCVCGFLVSFSRKFHRSTHCTSISFTGRCTCTKCYDNNKGNRCSWVHLHSCRKALHFYMAELVKSSWIFATEISTQICSRCFSTKSQFPNLLETVVEICILYFGQIFGGDTVAINMYSTMHLLKMCNQQKPTTKRIQLFSSSGLPVKMI